MLSADNNRRKTTAKKCEWNFFLPARYISKRRNGKMKINNECVERKAIYGAGAMPKLSENWSMEIINTIKLKDVYINLKRFLLLVKQKRR